jgi:hypothetical protein
MTTEVPSVLGNRRTTSNAESKRLKADSRVRGAVYEELMDTECLADGCERVFTPRLAGQEYCIKHRSEQH